MLHYFQCQLTVQTMFQYMLLYNDLGFFVWENTPNLLQLQFQIRNGY